MHKYEKTAPSAGSIGFVPFGNKWYFCLTQGVNLTFGQGTRSGYLPAESGSPPSLTLDSESEVEDLVWKTVRSLGELPVLDESQLEEVSAGTTVGVGRGVPRLPKSRREEIVRAYQDGLAHGAIAGKFGVHRSTVTRILRAEGIGPAGPVLGDSLVGEVRAFYAAGKSVTATAHYFGVSRNTMMAFMGKHGLERRKTTDWHGLGAATSV